MNDTERLAFLEERLNEVATGVDGGWLILTGVGILGMQAGFMLFEAGLTRMKHVKSILFKNLLDHSIGACAWVFIGWGLYNGDGPIAGGSGSTHGTHPITDYPRMLQQFGFAVTASTIVSGAVATRMKLSTYVAFSFVMVSVLYPVAAHWAWSSGGWLGQLGFKDYAGSGVVHTFGGSCAIAGALLVGHRAGRYSQMGIDDSAHGGSEYSEGAGSEASVSQHFLYRVIYYLSCGNPRRLQRLSACCGFRGDPNIRVRDMAGHSATLVAQGGMLLYLSWFSFNAGSSGGIAVAGSLDAAGLAAINTLLAAGTSSATALLWRMLPSCRRRQRQHNYSLDVGFLTNGLLAGLVAVTAPCGFVHPWAAVVVGFLSIPVFVFSSHCVTYVFYIDDAVDAFSVHAACGLLGTVWLGLAHPEVGAFYHSDSTFFWVQVLGGFVYAGFGFFTTFILLFPFKRMGLLSYTIEEQLVGLDFVYFAGSSYPEFDSEAVQEYNTTQRIKKQYEARRAANRMSRMGSESSMHGADRGSMMGGIVSVTDLMADTPSNGGSTHGRSPRSSAFVFDMGQVSSKDLLPAVPESGPSAMKSGSAHSLHGR